MNRTIWLGTDCYSIVEHDTSVSTAEISPLDTQDVTLKQPFLFPLQLFLLCVIVKMSMSALTRGAAVGAAPREQEEQINKTVEALAWLKTAPWWLYKTQMHSGRTLRVFEAIWVERHEAMVSKWEMRDSWEDLMSWVMADTVGQSEHHYSAGFFSPSPRIISAQQWDT